MTTYVSVTPMDFWHYLLTNPIDLCMLIAGVILLISGLAILLRTVFAPFAHKRYWVGKAAKELDISKKEVRAQFREVLREAEQCIIDQACSRTAITYYYPLACKNELGMKAMRLRVIAYTPVWIYYVVVCCDLWKTAFYQSIGHEIEHRNDPERGFWFMFRSKEDRRFYHWLNEVRCDFAGVEFARWNGDVFGKLPNGRDRNEIIRAMEKKATVYEAGKRESQKEAMSHPSWELRIELLKKYRKFDYDVVEEVAAAAGCKNRKYINDLCSQTTLPF